MKTVKCPECETPISSWASTCPRCGCDIRRWVQWNCKPTHMYTIIARAYWAYCGDSHGLFKLTWDSIYGGVLKFYFASIISDGRALRDDHYQWSHEFGDVGKKTLYDMLRYVTDPENVPYPEHDMLTFKSEFYYGGERSSECDFDCVIKIVKDSDDEPDLKFEDSTLGYSGLLVEDCFQIYNSLDAEEFTERYVADNPQLRK